MMIAIPLGYFVACFLIVAGFLGGMDFLGNRPADISRAELLVKLSAAAWPMIAGCGLLLLSQIAKQLENLRLVASYTPEEESAPKKKKKKAPNKSKEAAEATPAPPPAPAPEPQPAPTPAPAPAPVKIQGVITMPDVAGSALNSAQSASRTATPVPPSSTRTPVYPNSPIPGGGRVPQPPPPMPPQAEGIANLPSGGKRAPRKGENQGLSFFKVD